jgi:hypothetical protein
MLPVTRHPISHMKAGLMKHIRLIILALAVVAMLPSSGYAEGAGIEWDILNDEVKRLYGAGKYDRAAELVNESETLCCFGYAAISSGLLIQAAVGIFGG